MAKVSLIQFKIAVIYSVNVFHQFMHVFLRGCLHDIFFKKINRKLCVLAVH